MSIKFEKLDDGSKQIAVYDDVDQTKIGSLTYIKQPEAIKICYLSVCEEFRGLGLADSLLSSLLFHAREESVPAIVGDYNPVPETEDAAWRLYTSNGFTIKNGKIRREID